MNHLRDIYSIILVAMMIMNMGLLIMILVGYMGQHRDLGIFGIIRTTNKNNDKCDDNMIRLW